MDFPVCPACGQSVIDDDVEDCPFCGSSMKAKPGSKPPAAKSAPAASAKSGAAASKPTATPAAKSPAAAKGAAGAKPGGTKSGGDDDFPFENDLPAAKTAIQAVPNATKQRSLKVVCPMCETAGYVVPTAAGQDVKCANPKCMVPVFKAPVPVVEAPPPPPKKSNLPMILGGTVAVIALAAVGIFVLPGMLASKPKQTGLSEEAKQALLEMNQDNTKAVTNGTPNTPATDQANATKKVEDDQPKVAPKSADESIAAALKQMADSCLVGDRRQRSKAFCRQLAAEACALTGEAVGLKEHLAQLDVVGRDVPYYKITPHLESFWRAWAAGDKAAAAKSLDAAMAEAPKIPKVGRNQLEIAGRLAAALAAAGRIPEGLTLLQGHQQSDGDGQLAARVQMSFEGRAIPLSSLKTVLPWSAPQAAAATMTLMTRGESKAARDWAAAQPNEDAKAECLAVWAEATARTQAQPGSADSNAELVEAVKPLAPALAARVWARATCGRLTAKDQDGAAATLKLARDLLATIPVPSEPTMPDVKQTMKYELPKSVPLVQAATAAAEIAFVQSLSPQTVSDAEASLDLALQFARGIAPGWPAASQRSAEAERAGAGGLQTMLKRELALKSEDEARLAVGKYRRQVNDIADAAVQRFELQTKLLSRLLAAGLKEKAWLVISARSGETDPSHRDEFLNTPLVGELLEAFQGLETEKAIKGALPENLTPRRPDLAAVKELLTKGDAAAAAVAVSALDTKLSRRDDLALSLTTRLVSVDKLETALIFIGRLDDIVLREEAYRLVAALAAQRGQTETIWKQIALVGQQTEKVALCRGLIGGLKTDPAAEELPEPNVTP